MKRFWLLLGFLLLAVACQAGGNFKPRQGMATPAGPLTSNATLVSFADLDADPAAYLDQLIRVTGEMLLLEEEVCPRWRGPRLVWALLDQVGDEVMRLDAVGYEDIMRRVPEGTVMTVDGFWRLYEGPSGCGKEPPDGFVWYLEVTRLVQPNPLPLTGSGGGSTSPRVTLPPGELDEEPSPTPTPAVGTLTPSPTASRTPTSTPTLGAGTVAPTPTPSATPSATVSPTPTSSVPGGPTATPSQTPTQPASTRTGGSTPTPGASTPTPSGYPAPTVNPNPSPTSSGYP